MLDFAEALCGNEVAKKGWECEIEGVFDQVGLQRSFSPGTVGGELGSYHWEDHGKYFLNERAWLSIDASGRVRDLRLRPDFSHRTRQHSQLPQNIINARIDMLKSVAARWTHVLGGKRFCRVNAERDIRPEPSNMQLNLQSSGNGATNIIRRYLNSANLDRRLIKDTLLAALNEVFGSDATFTEIEAREHDNPQSGPTPAGHWEIYLGEESKGLIPLSKSGSGLKTVILVLLSLLVVPEIDQTRKSDYVFSVEEPENNLHPSLLRRLLKYIESYAAREGATFFITSHSSVALDLFGVSKAAQIIHVKHDGVSASASRVEAHLDKFGVISALGAKPSDLLQANGIIWVEGPSDRVYINHWIELFSDEKFREGRDYQCAFYGGSLLGRLQVVTPEEAVKEFVNVFTLNPNVAFVCDSDKTAPEGEDAALKSRVTRIKEELSRIPNSFLWITAGKEVENYLPGSVIGQVFENAAAKDPERFERFFPSESKDNQGDSYVEAVLNRKAIDKVDLASRAIAFMKDKDVLLHRFDLVEQVNGLIDRIRSWNR